MSLSIAALSAYSVIHSHDFRSSCRRCGAQKLQKALAIPCTPRHFRSDRGQGETLGQNRRSTLGYRAQGRSGNSPVGGVRGGATRMPALELSHALPDSGPPPVGMLGCIPPVPPLSGNPSEGTRTGDTKPVNDSVETRQSSNKPRSSQSPLDQPIGSRPCHGTWRREKPDPHPARRSGTALPSRSWVSYRFRTAMHRRRCERAMTRLVFLLLLSSASGGTLSQSCGCPMARAKLIAESVRICNWEGHELETRPGSS